MLADRLRDVRLYVVTDATPVREPIDAFVHDVVAGGASMVQLRERRLADRPLLAAARAFAAACGRAGALFIVNDRVDIAQLCGADGVHVGQEDIHPDDVRRIAGSDFIIGLSTHTTAEIDAAAATEADYIGVGPVHETPTKPGRQPVGVDLVRYAARSAVKTFFAIGGIDASNVADVIAAGARAVAVVRAVTQSPDPAGSASRILEAMGSRPERAQPRMTGR